MSWRLSFAIFVLGGSLLAMSSTSRAATCGVPTAEFNAPNGDSLEVVEGRDRNRLLYQESHALLIGESDYTPGSGWPKLRHVPAELDALGNVLKLHGFHILRYDNLDSTKLSNVVECFVKTYGYHRDARIVLYFSGHGYTRTDKESTGDRPVGYVLPTDASKAPDQPDSPQEEALIAKALRLTQFQEWASAMEARHVLLIFDSCFSGTILGHRGSINEALKPKPLGYVLSASAQSPVRWFLTSGSADQTVPAVSAFNTLLVQALSGLRPEADVNHDGFITSGELVSFLKGTLPTINPDQTPDDGKIADPLLNVGDMAFRIPDREDAAQIVQAAATSRPISLRGRELAVSAVTQIATSTVAPPPKIAVLPKRDEQSLAQAVQDLESTDTARRRGARSILARLIAANGSGFVGELVRGLPHGSYRYQLGVAEALANAPGGWSAADDGSALTIVRARQAGAKDLSLKTALTGAISNAK